MPNFNPLMLLILSLLLVTSAIASSSTTTIPSLSSYYYVYAQDEEDKDEEEQEEQKEEQEEEGDTKDEDKDEEQKEEEQSEQPAAEPAAAEPTQEQTIQQTVKDELHQLLLNSSLSSAQPQQPAAAAPIIQYEEQKSSPTPPLNLKCNCTTNNTETFIHPPTITTTTTIPPTTTTTTTSTLEQLEQIQITPQDITSSLSNGEITNPDYTSFYTVSNLFDNLINEYSFWSQAGPNSSFEIKLNNKLDNYQVCSAEIYTYNPKNVPFTLDIGLGKIFTGVLDQPVKTLQFDNCVKNIDDIKMTFDSPTGQYVSIGELKLFGNKLSDIPSSPSPKPPTEPAAPYDQNDATKINIKNSSAEIDITNSTVTFKFDPQSAKATGYNVITIPNTEVVK